MKNFFKTLVLVCLMIFNVIHAPLNAHPHVFIANRIQVVFDDKGVAGFKVFWAFDDMFSAMIAQDFDNNKDGTLNNEEIKTIKEKAFAYIAPHNYYIHIKINGKEFPVKFIRDFTARLEQGKLFYEFVIPCHVRALSSPKSIVISPYDTEYYSALYFTEKNPVSIKSPKGFTVETQIKEDPNTRIYYDMVHPWSLFLRFKIG